MDEHIPTHARVWPFPGRPKDLRYWKSPGIYLFSSMDAAELAALLAPLLSVPKPQDAPSGPCPSVTAASRALAALLPLRSANILYVGRAKSLSQRLSSYFASGYYGEAKKLMALREKARSVIALPAANHFEAAVREIQLIRALQSPINSQLRDVTQLHMVLAGASGVRIGRTRRRGERLLGFCSSARATADAIEIMIRQAEAAKEGRSLTPFSGIRATPRREVGLDPGIRLDVLRCLRGKKSALVAALKRAMWESAAQEHYMHAARLRDALLTIRALQSRLRESLRVYRKYRNGALLFRNAAGTTLHRFEVRQFVLQGFAPTGEESAPNLTSRLRIHYEILRMIEHWHQHQPESCEWESPP